MVPQYEIKLTAIEIAGLEFDDREAWGFGACRADADPGFEEGLQSLVVQGCSRIGCNPNCLATCKSGRPKAAAA